MFTTVAVIIHLNEMLLLLYRLETQRVLRASLILDGDGDHFASRGRW